VSLSGVTAVAAGHHHNLALRADGTVVAWGRNNHGQRDVPAGLTGVVAISAGERHSVAVRRDGTVVSWGGDARAGLTGTSGYPGTSGYTGVLAVAAGYDFTLLLCAAARQG